MLKTKTKRVDIVRLHELMAYNPETGVLSWRERPASDFPSERERNRWNSRYAGQPALASLKKNKGYFTGSLDKKFAQAHVVAWAMHNGRWPEGQIDHINGCKTDNRAENLREVTSRENNRNRSIPSTNTSGVMGVARDPEQPHKWRASIRERGFTRVIGRFDTADQAIAARKAAEVRLGFHENHGRASA